MSQDEIKGVTLLLLLNRAMEQLSPVQRESIRVTDREIEIAIRSKEFPTRIICSVDPMNPLAPKVYKAVFSNNEVRKRTRVFDIT